MGLISVLAIALGFVLAFVCLSVPAFGGIVMVFWALLKARSELERAVYGL